MTYSDATTRADTRDGRSFKVWLQEVDKILGRRIGLGHRDLADFCSFDLWDSGCSPLEGAEECLAGDDTFSDFGIG